MSYYSKLPIPLKSTDELVDILLTDDGLGRTVKSNCLMELVARKIAESDIPNVPAPHWHDVNPWRDQITYVPIEELAECVAGGKVRLFSSSAFNGEETVDYTAEYVLNSWKQGGDKLDAYILPQPSSWHSIGIRYGAEGSQYLSPNARDKKKVDRLLKRYQKGE